MLDISRDEPVAVIGLGYVGLPLAVAFGRVYPTIGYDVDAVRVQELSDGFDRTREVSTDELRSTPGFRCTSEPRELAGCRVFIVAVPTPVNRHKQPDLEPLRRASETVGRVMAPGAVVIFESTVYPGATEEVCVPLLEAASGLRYNREFHAGYSPERINPGDRVHRLESIVKVTSGSTPAVAAAVDAFYARVVTAGTHSAPSIRVAEAAKVIENTQRDLNIALVNELAIIFGRLGIDTQAVLEAAGTKWNFLPFRPGLVGGHCIGVDPYYLTHKAQEIGYHPQVILSGRQINDSMGVHVAEQLVKLLTRRRVHVVGARVLILGLTFKENCPDLRNTRVVDVVRELEGYNAEVDIHDPWIDADEARREYDVRVVTTPEAGRYDAIVLAVAHQQFVDSGIDSLRRFGNETHVFYDIKSVFPSDRVDARL